MSDSPNPTPIGIVIPCFKESQRLPPFLDPLCTLIAKNPDAGIRLLAVDDGSGTTESKKLKAYVDHMRQQYPFLLPLVPLARNRGKGGAILAGWEHLITLKPEPGFLGFVDADGAISADEVLRMVKALITHSASEPPTAWFASRIKAEHTTVNRHYFRAFSGLVFRKLVRMAFKFPIRDTQCGFKILPTQAYHPMRSKLIEHRFLFDIELTHHLIQQYIPIQEFPISWQETAGGHITGASVARMATGLWRLRRRLGPAPCPHD